MKLSTKTFTILFTAATLYACNGNDKTNGSTGADSSKSAAMDTSHSSAMDTSHSTMDTSHAMTGTSASSPEQDFLNYAIPANTKELIWLKAGLAKGTLKDIKSHSAMMIKDHTKLDGDVKKYMSKKPNLTAPSLDTANTITINDKTGSDWDKAWTDKMVDDHSDLLDKLKKSQKDVKDPELNKLITNTIPVVASHLSMVKMVQGKLKK